MTYHVWTDGAYSHKSGQGGYGAVIDPSPYGGFEKLLIIGVAVPEDSPTNQRMELNAVVEALSRLEPGATAEVFTDSQYVAHTVNRGWKKRANRDLWEALYNELQRVNAHITWIPRNSCPELVKCDKLAKQGSHTTLDTTPEPCYINSEGGKTFSAGGN